MDYTSEDYKNGLAELVNFSEYRLKEWKDNIFQINNLNRKLEVLQKQNIEEEKVCEQLIAQKNSNTSYFRSDNTTAELTNMIADSENRIKKLKTAIELVEGCLPSQKIKIISYRRRYRESCKSIEIYERNYLKSIVGKAKHQQRRINILQLIPRNEYQ
jgi:hypothetical protein